MNKLTKNQLDILQFLYHTKKCSQRQISNSLHMSLGHVNSDLKTLVSNKYINNKYELLDKAFSLINNCRTKHAIILAAGFGTRMVPINLNTPKALLEIKSEKLIERLIKQLNEAKIFDIHVVVGFMKEKFEYLIDKYNIDLIVNPSYIEKNNLYSLFLACSYLSDCYIIPSDIYCIENPFNSIELYSWYMLTDEIKNNTGFTYLKNGDVLAKIENNQNKELGIAYIKSDDSFSIKEAVNQFGLDPLHDNDYWESTLYKNGKLIIKGKLVSKDSFFEINTYEQLRDLDKGSNQLKNEAIDIIKETFHVDDDKIVSLKALKKGMTNRSFLFECNNNKYIMRIPGEGTGKLINREEEAQVYNLIKDRNICDNVLYINPKNGYKISEYINGARCCNPLSEDDLIKCIKFLKNFHNLKLIVNHEFNIFDQIDFYESLWKGKKSDYMDYDVVKKNILSLKCFIEKNVETKCLSHIDAVPDNFLIFTDKNGNEIIRLIDWEYAGMQDPHVDIAMFCIYSLYNKSQIDHLIDLYFDNKCSNKIRAKIYCYIASCGLLWSNWCEYKKMLGVEFGEYSLAQYRYAKEYYKYAVSLMEAIDE